MSSQTNNAYVTKSCNGIIDYSDGNGGSMSGGVISANTLATKNISSNSLQPFDTSTNYNLYTTATNNIYLANAGIVVYTAAPISSTNTIIASQFNAPNGYLTQLDSIFINTSTLNASTINVSTLNIGTTSFGVLNCTSINASTANISTSNAINANASYVSCQELYTEYGEIGNIAFSNETISVIGLPSVTITMFPTLTTGLIDFGKNMTTGIITIGSSTSIIKIGNFNINANQLGITSPTATVDLFPALTTGTINIGTNVTTTGAITIGNGAATGSFSVSEGTININPKTTLNIANQIVSGTMNICNANTYRGTLNICATANVSNASTNTINIGSSTTANLNLGCPLTPNYNSFYNVTTGITRTTGIGYIITAGFRATSVQINSGTTFVLGVVGTYTNLPIGVWRVDAIFSFLQLAGATTTTTLSGAYFMVGSSLTSIYVDRYSCHNLLLQVRGTAYGSQHMEQLNTTISLTTATTINAYIGFNTTNGANLTLSGDNVVNNSYFIFTRLA